MLTLRRVEWVARHAAYGGAAAGLALAYGSMIVFRKWAMYDRLTKVESRRAYDLVSASALRRAARTGEPVSVAVLDIDHFKDVNTDFGHDGGDRALLAVAQVWDRERKRVKGRMGRRVVFARWGGEEFVLLLPGYDTSEAVAVAERFRQATGDAWPTRRLSASVGVATFPQHASDGDSLIKAADKALYVSKNEGRDRVTAADGC